MKKIFILFIIGLSVLFSSCNNDYSSKDNNEINNGENPINVEPLSPVGEFIESLKSSTNSKFEKIKALKDYLLTEEQKDISDDDINLVRSYTQELINSMTVSDFPINLEEKYYYKDLRTIDNECTEALLFVTSPKPTLYIIIEFGTHVWNLDEFNLNLIPSIRFKSGTFERIITDKNEKYYDTPLGYNLESVIIYPESYKYIGDLGHGIKKINWNHSEINIEGTTLITGSKGDKFNNNFKCNLIPNSLENIYYESIILNKSYSPYDLKEIQNKIINDFGRFYYEGTYKGKTVQLIFNIGYLNNYEASLIIYDENSYVQSDPLYIVNTTYTLYKNCNNKYEKVDVYLSNDIYFTIPGIQDKYNYSGSTDWKTWRDPDNNYRMEEWWTNLIDNKLTNNNYSCEDAEKGTYWSITPYCIHYDGNNFEFVKNEGYYFKNYKENIGDIYTDTEKTNTLHSFLYSYLTSDTCFTVLNDMYTELLYQEYIAAFIGKDPIKNVSEEDINNMLNAMTNSTRINFGHNYTWAYPDFTAWLEKNSSEN